MDANILLWIQDNLRNPVLNSIFKVVTNFGSEYAIILICICLLLFKKTRKVGILCTIALLLSVGTTSLIVKPLVARPRPYEAVAGLTSVIGPEVEYSFPSGHTNATFTIAIMFWYVYGKKIGIPALIAASLVAFSRLYVGVHYPTDILGGICFALLFSTLVWKGYKKYDRSRV
jgi:membrane-associated phospholipid phosphatase